MTKKYRFFFTTILICLFISCSFKTQEFFVLEKIDPYNDPEKNEQIGKDLMYYDYATLIKDSLKITDPSYLQNISWQDFVASDTKEVTFRLYLQNEAIEKKNELVALFDHFVANKIEEYKKKEKKIDTAISIGFYYIQLINRQDYDSIWKQTSPLLEKYANKEQFTNMLTQRNTHYKSPPDLKVDSRIIFNKIDNVAGDFYVIYYVGDNSAKEKVTMEKINSTYRLLAYQCAIPK